MGQVFQRNNPCFSNISEDNGTDEEGTIDDDISLVTVDFRPDDKRGRDLTCDCPA